LTQHEIDRDFVTSGNGAGIPGLSQASDLLGGVMHLRQGRKDEIGRGDAWDKDGHRVVAMRIRHSETTTLTSVMAGSS
jgi:hypothetical protein